MKIEPIQCTCTHILSNIPQLVVMDSKSILAFVMEIMWHDQILFLPIYHKCMPKCCYQRKVYLALMRFLLRYEMLKVNLATSLISNESENCKTVIQTLSDFK